MEFKQVITANFEKQLRQSTATVGRDAEQRGPSYTTSRSTAWQKCILSEKAPDMNSLRGKGSCGSQFQRLHHSQGLCCPYTCGEVMHDGENCSPHDSQETETERKGPGTTYTLQSHIPSDLLPPTMLYLLAAPLTMKS